MNDFEMELAFLEAMGVDERKLHFITEDGKAAAYKLDQAIHRVEQNRYDITFAKHMAKQYLVAYNESKRDSDLAALEDYVELLKSYRAYKDVLLSDVKQERERVRWFRGEYQKLKETLTLPKS